MRTLLAVGLVGWLVAGAGAGSVTVEECDRWIGELQGEAAAVDESDDDGPDLVEPLREARRQGRKRDAAASTKQIREFRKRLAKTQGLSDIQRDTLGNLAETAQRCLDAAEDAEEDEDDAE